MVRRLLLSGLITLAAPLAAQVAPVGSWEFSSKSMRGDPLTGTIYLTTLPGGGTWGGRIFTLIGLGLGIAGALILGRVLSGFLNQVTPRDPGTIAGAAAVLLAAAVLASWLPSRRATRVDPAETLRAD